MSLIPQFNKGRRTRYKDCKGRAIREGSYIRCPVTINQELHGPYAYFRVAKGDDRPILRRWMLYYERSENGQKLPQGYLSNFLSNVPSKNMLVLFDGNVDIN